MHITKIDGKYPVAFKPNNIIFKTKDDNSTLEKQLLLVLFIAPAVKFPENREVTIDVDLITDKPLQGSICSRIRKAIDNITDSKFVTYQDSTHYEFINVFEKAGRRGNKITATITQSAIDTIKEYLPKGFTKISTGDTIRLKTVYQFVLLEAMLKYRKFKHKSIDINYIKRHASITDKYQRSDNFNRRVIEPSVLGINNILGYSIKCIPLKQGNKVTAIKLYEDKKRDSSKITKSKSIDKKSNKEDDNFNYISRCYDLIPSMWKERYVKNIPVIYGSQVILSTAINDFSIEFSELLEKSNSPEEFIRAFNSMDIVQYESEKLIS